MMNSANYDIPKCLNCRNVLPTLPSKYTSSILMTDYLAIRGLHLYINMDSRMLVNIYVRATTTRATKQQLAPFNVSATLALPSAWFCIFKCTDAVRGRGNAATANQTCSYFKSRWVWMWIPKRKHFVLNAMLTIEKKHPYQGHKQLHSQAVSVALIMWADLWQWQSEKSF